MFGAASHILAGMGSYSESPTDRLIKEYGAVFNDFDDLTLARWMCQTLGQIAGRAWRLSHPLIGAYRVAAQAGPGRPILFKKGAGGPHTEYENGRCPAALLRLF